MLEDGESRRRGREDKPDGAREAGASRAGSERLNAVDMFGCNEGQLAPIAIDASKSTGGIEVRERAQKIDVRVGRTIEDLLERRRNAKTCYERASHR